MNAEWFYIGHYGQIGPLTREQLEELIDGGVVTDETFVWRSGMTEWLPANRVPDLMVLVRKANVLNPPPPPNLAPTTPPAVGRVTSMAPGLLYTSPLSDKSRSIGGILQLIPGVGRMYLGYAAIGVLQLILAPFCVGIAWSWIDGILILSGGVRLDGYGRRLGE